MTQCSHYVAPVVEALQVIVAMTEVPLASVSAAGAFGETVSMFLTACLPGCGVDLPRGQWHLLWWWQGKM